MARQSKAVVGADSLTLLADRGYFSGEEVVACEAAGVIPIVPKPLTSGAKADGRFGKQGFIYQPETDTYRCPAGEQPIWCFTTVEHGLTLSGDMLGEKAVRHRRNRVLAPLALPIARRIVAVDNRYLLPQRFDARLIRGQRPMRAQRQPGPGGSTVFEEIGFGAARPAANAKAGELVIPGQNVPLRVGLDRIDGALGDFRGFESRRPHQEISAAYRVIAIGDADHFILSLSSPAPSAAALR